VPTLLITQGITITNSLFYTTLIALTAPVGPLLGLLIADRFERPCRGTIHFSPGLQSISWRDRVPTSDCGASTIEAGISQCWKKLRRSHATS
jgi:hypothetical protein